MGRLGLLHLGPGSEEPVGIRPHRVKGRLLGRLKSQG